MTPTLEYLIHDFLEIGCRLSLAERETAVSMLKHENIQAERLEVHSVFSVDGKMMIVLKPGQLKECFFYFPEHRRMEKRGFTEDGFLTSA